MAQQAKCYLWPCNVAAFRAWQQVQTQWRYGPAGNATGLDYAGVSAFLLNQPGPMKPRKRTQLFSLIRAMEWAALEVWDKKRR